MLLASRYKYKSSNIYQSSNWLTISDKNETIILIFIEQILMYLYENLLFDEYYNLKKDKFKN
ncbi:MAG: hypothetical protein P8Y70_14260, partial [Candidatus Lokiarchaeota archaeon]